MFLFHIAIELTLRYQENTEGGKRNSTGRRSIIQRKDKARKTEREGKKMSPLAVALSQYVATIAE